MDRTDFDDEIEVILRIKLKGENAQMGMLDSLKMRQKMLLYQALG